MQLLAKIVAGGKSKVWYSVLSVKAAAIVARNVVIAGVGIVNQPSR